MRAKRKPEPKKPKLLGQEWIVSRGKANPAVAAGYHIQVSTKDTLAGFVVVTGMVASFEPKPTILRGKSASGEDYFSLNLGNAVTFNLVGKIEYRGDWDGVP